MKSDTEKTKDELIEEISDLRTRLQSIEEECSELKAQCEESNNALSQECTERDRTEEHRTVKKTRTSSDYWGKEITQSENEYKPCCQKWMGRIELRACHDQHKGDQQA